MAKDNKKDKVIEFFFEKKMANKVIADELGVSSAYVSQVCSAEKRARKARQDAIKLEQDKEIAKAVRADVKKAKKAVYDSARQKAVKRDNKKVLDWNLINDSIQILCTGEEIAGLHRIDYDTLRRRIEKETNMTFAEYYEMMAANGRASLRRIQYKAAMGQNYGERVTKDGSIIEVRIDPSVPIMTFLGKQFLGQKDVIENKVVAEIPKALGVKIEHVDAS